MLVIDIFVKVVVQVKPLPVKRISEYLAKKVCEWRILPNINMKYVIKKKEGIYKYIIYNYKYYVDELMFVQFCIALNWGQASRIYIQRRPVKFILLSAFE